MKFLKSLKNSVSLKKVKILPIIFVVLFICGCNETDKKTSSGNNALSEGGVDGSGGNLKSFEYLSFKDWIENIHKHYLRDAVYRLLTIKKNSPEEFKFNPIVDKFLGENPDKILDLAQSLKFISNPKSCRSSNHGDSDSAVTKDGVVCFSFPAFKRFTSMEFLNKLLAISFHEMAHMRGFSEKEAVELQLSLEDNEKLGKEIFLTNNLDYRISRELVAMMGRHLGSALSFLMSRNDESLINACNSLTRAHENATNFYFYGQALPTFLESETTEKLAFPIGQLSLLNCRKFAKKELAQKIALIIEDFISISKNFERYESPLCTGNLCTNRRWIRAISTEEDLLKWNLVKNYFNDDLDYPITMEDNISCHLKNLTDNKNVELVVDQGALKVSGDELAQSTFKYIFLIKDMFLKNIVEISLQHQQNVQLFNVKGFSPSSAFQTTGFIQEGSNKEISVDLAIMNPNLDAPRKLGDLNHEVEDIPYTTFDPFFYAISNVPTIIKMYRLTCKLE